MRWLKSPTTTRRFADSRLRTSARPARYCSWSSHRILRSRLRLASVRDPNQGIQTPITVTSPTDVRVTPDTNRPVGIESFPTSSTCLPGFPRPEHDLPPIFFDRVPVVGLRGDHVPTVRQQPAARLGEADDLRGVSMDATQNLSAALRPGRRPLDIPVNQSQRQDLGSLPLGTARQALAAPRRRQQARASGRGARSFAQGGVSGRQDGGSVAPYNTRGFRLALRTMTMLME